MLNLDEVLLVGDPNPDTEALHEDNRLHTRRSILTRFPIPRSHFRRQIIPTNVITPYSSAGRYG